MKNIIAIDMGNEQTIITFKGKIVLREPTIAVGSNREIVAFGNRAVEEFSLNPSTLFCVKPIKCGVVENFEVAQKMIEHFIRKVLKLHRKILGSPFKKPTLLFCVSPDINYIQKRTIANLLPRAKVEFVYQPICSAIGADVDISSVFGNMIVDIGSSKTQASTICIGNIVSHDEIAIGGNDFDKVILDYIEKTYGIIIGRGIAKSIKHRLESLENEDKYVEIRGRDIETRLPKSVKLFAKEIYPQLDLVVEKIIACIKTTIEKTPPEVAGDLIENGIQLCGGGAKLFNLTKKIERTLGVKTFVAQDSQDCCAIGMQKSLKTSHV